MFGIGLAVAAVVGLLFGVFSSASVGSAVGYAVVMCGVGWLLLGGLSGGGYTVFGTGAGIRRWEFFGYADDPGLIDELRRGYRSGASREAFWQVIGGLLYVLVGFAMVVVTS